MNQKRTSNFNIFSLISLIILLVLSLYVTFYFWSNKVLSSKSDFVHHYMLIKQFLLHGTREGFEYYLSEILVIYPAFSHWLTAKASLLFNSNIIFTISFLSTVFILLFFLSIYLISIDWDKRNYRTISFLFLCLLGFKILTALGLSIENMIISNHFYSQLASFSILLFLLLIIFKTTYENIYLRSIFIISLFTFSSFIHVAPPVNLISICIAYSLIEIFYNIFKLKISFKKNLKYIFEISIYIIFTLLSFKFSPAFELIRTALSAEGVLNFVLPNSIIIAGSIIFSLISCIIYIRIIFKNGFKLTKTRIMILALYNGSVAIMIAQLFFLYIFDIGSVYSLKKYFFSISIFFIPCFLTLIFDLYELKKPSESKLSKVSFINLFLIVIIITTLSQIATLAVGMKTSNVLQYNNFINYTTAIKNIPELKEGETIFIDKESTGFLNYLITVGELRAPLNTTTIPLVYSNYEGVYKGLSENKHNFKHIVFTKNSINDTLKMRFKNNNLKIINQFNIYSLRSK